jgi:hypothetical protein
MGAVDRLRLAGAHIWAALKTVGGLLSDPASAGLWGLPGQQHNGRVVVSEQTALNISAVWAAVRIISGSVAVLPHKVYRRGPDGGRQEEDRAPGSTLAQATRTRK